VSEQHPGEVEDDDGRDGLADPASSHGSDLDARIGAAAEDLPDTAKGTEEAGPGIV
jgi:hypothetical protein